MPDPIPAGPAADRSPPASRRERTRRLLPSTSTALLTVGGLGALTVSLTSRNEAVAATEQSWPPFVLVAGLLLVGVVAHSDGLFEAGAAMVARIPGGPVALFAAAMGLVAAVTVLLNLDTSVVFLTPILVLVARARGVSEERFLYGCVFMSNSASLLLPGSNLTNLLVLSREHVSGARFLARMALPWAAAVLVTGIVVALHTRGPGVSLGHRGDSAVRPRLGGAAAVLVALGLVVTLGDQGAIPILILGVVATAVRVVQGRVELGTVRSRVDVGSLLGILGIAVALGTVARLTSIPHHLVAEATSWETAGVAAIASVLVNNLPAAVVLGSGTLPHPRSLLIGLDIGPNLAVSGSLSVLLWWQAARSVGARTSVLRYSRIGAWIVPLAMAAALAAATVSPGGS